MSAAQSSRETALTTLHRFEFILQHQSDRLLRSSLGVGFGQFCILEELDASLARSQRELARRLYQTEANISRQLGVMSKKGLVSVKKNKKDGRQRDVTLTAKGTHSYKRARLILNTRHDEILGLLSKDQAAVFESSIEHLLRAASIHRVGKIVG